MTSADESPETARQMAPELESAAATVAAENLKAIVEEAYRPKRSQKVDLFKGYAARHRDSWQS
jgi:D-alanyl-D-alanine dipeptidase